MKILITFLTAILLVGCNISNDFDLLSENGKVYRLNKKTGEIIVLSKDGIQKYDDNYIQKRYEQNLILNKTKIDESKSFPESNSQMWSTLKYKWRNDKILYRYEFGPYSEALNDKFNDGFNSITIQFLDDDGFEVCSSKILLSSLTRIVGDDGKPKYWSYEGSINCSKDDFLLISNWTHPWSFSYSLKRAIKTESEKFKNKYLNDLNKIRNMLNKYPSLGEVRNDTLYLNTANGFKAISDKKIISYIAEHPDEFLDYFSGNNIKQ